MSFSAFSFIQIRWLRKDTFINFHDLSNEPMSRTNLEVVYPLPNIYASYTKRRDSHTVGALLCTVVLSSCFAFFFFFDFGQLYFLAKIRCIVLWVKIKNIRMN